MAMKDDEIKACSSSKRGLWYALNTIEKLVEKNSFHRSIRITRFSKCAV